MPRWRMPAGIAMILLLILIWAAIVVSLSDRIGALPFVLEMLVYVVAGTVWIAPLKPLLRWMETGRWR